MTDFETFLTGGLLAMGGGAGVMFRWFMVCQDRKDQTIKELILRHEDRVKELTNGSQDKTNRFMSSLQATMDRTADTLGGVANTLNGMAVICKSRNCPADKKEAPQ